jgi:segregation and condensation protein A
MGYEVRTEVFEGPFDLLFRLITAEQVDVYEISLARIVDAYLAEVKRLEAFDLDVATEFLLIAASLVELKCRRLLPGVDDADLGEELALFEERDLLLARLVECKSFSGAAGELAALERKAACSLARRAGFDERFADVRPDLLAGVTPAMLQAAAAAALTERPRPRVEVDHVLVDEVTVAEVVDTLAGLLPALGPSSFRRLTADLEHRIQVIVHFLAVLELYKQGLVELDQVDRFGDLVVTWTGAGPEAVDGGARPSVALVDADYRG